ncbi:hypothetical protein [Streptomyces sp. NPDC021622]|uniref:hypothetical protein n=1 Tax=Streptomyces sp. NPDC021622 TaxID=3155013 RepID=UPI0034052CF5
MNDSAPIPGHTTEPTVPGHEQSTPMSGVGTERALIEIVRLANELCEHLADGQWHTAARIRELAETTLLNAGDR